MIVFHSPFFCYGLSWKTKYYEPITLQLLRRVPNLTENLPHLLQQGVHTSIQMVQWSVAPGALSQPRHLPAHNFSKLSREFLNNLNYRERKTTRIFHPFTSF